MEKYKRISNTIQELSKGAIIRKKISFIIPCILIIVGVIFMWWGISHWTIIGYDKLCYVLVFGGLFLIGWASVMMAVKANIYIIRDTQEVIKPERINLNPDNIDLIKELLDQGNLREVLKQSITTTSPLLLEVWKNHGHNLIYSQLLYYDKSKYEPVSKPSITDKSNL